MIFQYAIIPHVCRYLRVADINSLMRTDADTYRAMLPLVRVKLVESIDVGNTVTTVHHISMMAELNIIVNHCISIYSGQPGIAHCLVDQLHSSYDGIIKFAESEIKYYTYVRRGLAMHCIIYDYDNDSSQALSAPSPMVVARYIDSIKTFTSTGALTNGIFANISIERMASMVYMFEGEDIWYDVASYVLRF